MAVETKILCGELSFVLLADILGTHKLSLKSNIAHGVNEIDILTVNEACCTPNFGKVQVVFKDQCIQLMDDPYMEQRGSQLVAVLKLNNVCDAGSPIVTIPLSFTSIFIIMFIYSR